MPTTKKAPETKRIVTKGYKKSPRVNYQRFYAIKFSIELGHQNSRAIRAFFNISDSTYYRIAQAKDYADYRKLIGDTRVLPANKKMPADAPKRVTVKVQGSGQPDIAPKQDATLDKAAQVLELAQTVLDKAYAVEKEANNAPKRGGFFNRRG